MSGTGGSPLGGAPVGGADDEDSESTGPSAIPPRHGGYGGEAYGDPMGSGGSLSVLRAVAVAGQVVRVVFSETPQHRTPSGRADALNPSNYIFSVVSGAATAPTPVGVLTDVVAGPAWGVGNGSSPLAPYERGIDVCVDRQLVLGIRYQVHVRQVASAFGGGLGAPYDAQFDGVTQLSETRLPERRQDLIDIANPPAIGCWQIDDSGDAAPEAEDLGLVKRVLRRFGTRKNSFAHLPGYGLAVDLKSIGSTSKLAALKVDAINQISQEPEVAAVSVTTSIDGTGLTFVNSLIKTRSGRQVRLNASISSDGAVSAGA